MTERATGKKDRDHKEFKKKTRRKWDRVGQTVKRRPSQKRGRTRGNYKTLRVRS